MKKKALFVVASARGHLNGSLKASIPLQKKGYEVFYATHSSFESWVTVNGFIFNNISLNRYKLGETYVLEQNLFKKVFGYFLDKLSKIHLDFRICQILELKELTNLIRPDLVFIDSFLTDYHVAFMNSSSKCIQMETMVMAQKSADIPPLNSLVLPTHNSWSKFCILFLWKRVFLKTFFSDFFIKLVTFSQDSQSIWLKTLSYFKIEPRPNTKEKTLFHRRLSEIPCVVTSPKRFDFPRKIPNNIYHINSFIETDEIRKQDYKDSSIKKLLETIILRNKNTKIVYCSLGTLASAHFKEPSIVINKILRIFSNLTEYHLVLSLGNNISKNTLNLPENSDVFDFVNQLEILKSVDMMITHGGMNTISECIFAEVPMLVLPLNSKWDQKGNASRVKFHEIGLFGDIKDDSEEEITRKIKAIVTNPKIKYNIANLKKKILSDYNESNFLNFLDSIELTSSLNSNGP